MANVKNTNKSELSFTASGKAFPNVVNAIIAEKFPKILAITWFNKEKEIKKTRYGKDTFLHIETKESHGLPALVVIKCDDWKQNHVELIQISQPNNGTEKTVFSFKPTVEWLKEDNVAASNDITAIVYVTYNIFFPFRQTKEFLQQLAIDLEKNSRYRNFSSFYKGYVVCAENKTEKIPISIAPWIDIGKSHIGLTEGKNPVIQGMIDKLNSDFDYTNKRDKPISNDKEPWCGVFVYHCLIEADMPVTSNRWETPALNTFYVENWNERTIISEPKYGAIAVMNYGHVGMITGFDDKSIWLLGGNQPKNGAVKRDGEEVNITKYSRSLVSKYVIPEGYEPPTFCNFEK